MPDRDIEELPDTVAAKEVKRVLLPFLSQNEAIQVLRTTHQFENNNLSESDGQEEDVSDWNRIYQESLASVGDIDIDLLSPDYEEIEHEHVNEFIQTGPFRQALADLSEDPVLEHRLDESQEEEDEESLEELLPEWVSAEGQIDFEAIPDEKLQDYQIVNFPISHLVAMQKMVATEAYQDLPTGDEEYEELLEYCLPTEGQSVKFQGPINTQGGEFNGYQVISRDPNLGANIFTKQTPSGTQITFHIGGSPNFVQIKEYAGRYVLKNGYHRVAKLYEEGQETVPAVLSSANDWSDVTQNQGHFSSNVVLKDRPPLVTDFFAEWATEAVQPATNTVVRVIQEKTEIPR